MNPSARPSVKVNPCNTSEIFTPVAAPRQPRSAYGFPQGQSVETDLSRDKHGFLPLICHQIQGPTDAALDTVSPLVLSSAAFLVPHLAASSGAALFRGDA